MRIIISIYKMKITLTVLFGFLISKTQGSIFDRLLGDSGLPFLKTSFYLSSAASNYVEGKKQVQQQSESTNDRNPQQGAQPEGLNPPNVLPDQPKPQQTTTSQGATLSQQKPRQTRQSTNQNLRNNNPSPKIQTPVPENKQNDQQSWQENGQLDVPSSSTTGHQNPQNTLPPYQINDDWSN